MMSEDRMTLREFRAIEAREDEKEKGPADVRREIDEEYDRVKVYRFVPCPDCDRLYPAVLPRCPHCGG